MSNKISRLFKSLEQYWPYLIRDEMERRDVQRRLEAQLKGYTAWGEEQRKTQKAGTAEQIMQNLFHPEYFKKRNLPEATILSWLQKTYPQLIQEKGIQVPPDIEQQKAEADNLVRQLVAYQESGETMPEEVKQGISKLFGLETLGGTVENVMKRKEAAAERDIRGREVGVQEALVPVRKGELVARLKETGGQIGDMTAKEARDALTKLGTERRRYQAMLETKTSDLGDLLGEEETNQIKKNIEEIDKLEKEIKKKYSKEEATDTAAGKITATNPETGEKIYWDEKLKKWLPLK